MFPEALEVSGFNQQWKLS